MLKSPDTAAIRINEIEAHLSGRLLSCSEAVWRFLGLPLHKEWPPVMRLHIHLPNEQCVVFDPTADSEDIHHACESSTSTLLQWFELNKQDPAARSLLYTRVPEHYTWSQSNRQWSKRRTKAVQIGRTFSVSHRNTELFSLRRLLDVVAGATRWEDLLAVDGVIYSTFLEACKARGMSRDGDADVVAAFQHVSATNCSLVGMRREFALLLLHSSCQNPVALFEMFAADLCEHGNVTAATCAAALMEIEDVFMENGRSIVELGFQLPDMAHVRAPLACFRQHAFDQQQCLEESERYVSLFTSEQHHAMAAICDSVEGVTTAAPRLFSILSSAGTGKSLFINGVTWRLRAQNRIVLNVAASALAATVLAGGRTAHSCFRIPIPALSTSYCGLKGGERQLLRQSSVIFYDEISMVSTDVADTLDRSLREIMSQPDLPFGGKVVCFSGDFKQLLPVVPGSRNLNTVQECDWWRHCQPIRFTVNWRAAANPVYSAFLNDVGNGTISSVEVPPESRACDVAELVQRVYGTDLLTVPRSRRLILALTLESCRMLNDHCLDQIPGQAAFVNASDVTQGHRDLDAYPDDYIASLQVQGAPPAILQFKIGARYMIVKNYDHTRGVVNGTLCELLSHSRHIVEVRLLTGVQEGRIIVLPRCSFGVSSTNSGLPFDFTRVQFPLIPAYCVTVHKAQGQTLEAAGLFFERDCFAHGQLYTALSRVGGWDKLTVLLPEGDKFLLNMVRQHVLERECIR